MVALSDEQRQLNEHHNWLNQHDSQIRDIELWEAEVRGSLKTITYIVSIAMALPATIGTIYTLALLLGK